MDVRLESVFRLGKTIELDLSLRAESDRDVKSLLALDKTGSCSNQQFGLLRSSDKNGKLISLRVSAKVAKD